MENKYCEHNTCGGNVYINMNKCCNGGDTIPCTCIPTLKITIGEGGKFATLTEALEYAKTVVHNSLVIEMLSDVIETRKSAIYIGGLSDDDKVHAYSKTMVLNGNGHVLNLNSITDTSAFTFVLGGIVWIDKVTILAENVLNWAINIGTNAYVYIRENVNLIGSTAKTTCGYYLYLGGRLTFSYGVSGIHNFKDGIKALSTATVCYAPGVVSFTDVTTNLSPAPNTAGNGNAYIHVG